MRYTDPPKWGRKGRFWALLPYYPISKNVRNSDSSRLKTIYIVSRDLLGSAQVVFTATDSPNRKSFNESAYTGNIAT